MITLGFRFSDVNQRKPLVLDYLKYSKMNLREKQLGISLYDPVTACRLNCMGGIPKVFLELIKIAPDERMDFLNKWKAKMVTENEQFGMFCCYCYKRINFFLLSFNKHSIADLQNCCYMGERIDYISL
jgi:hypothetical protein